MHSLYLIKCAVQKKYCVNLDIILHRQFLKGSGYFASRGKIAQCCFAIWRQNSPNGYFVASARIVLSLILTLTLTQTLTLIVTLIPTLTLTQTLTQTEEKHYFASRGKIATFLYFSLVYPYLQYSVMTWGNTTAKCLMVTKFKLNKITVSN